MGLTSAERRIILFLSKTTLKMTQLIDLVEIPGKISQSDVKKATLKLLHSGVLILSPDRILSLGQLEEDQ